MNNTNDFPEPARKAVELDLGAIRARVEAATDRCGYTMVDADGEQRPCDREATGWRWYQNVEHEDALDTACDWHENVGGNTMHALLAEVERLRNAACDLLDEGLRQKRRANETRAALADTVPAARLAEAEAEHRALLAEHLESIEVFARVLRRRIAERDEARAALADTKEALDQTREQWELTRKQRDDLTNALAATVPAAAVRALVDQWDAECRRGSGGRWLRALLAEGDA